LSRLGSSSLTNIPEEVREHVKLLLNVTPTVRPDADQMTKVSATWISALGGGIKIDEVLFFSCTEN
jgi:hypothetical protein